MYRKIVFALISCLAAFPVFAQFQTATFNKERLTINKKGMYVLGSWAAVNVVWGAIGAATTTGTQKHFHTMNLGWGVINGGLAIFSIAGFKKEMAKTFTDGQTIHQQQGVEKLFLLNAGLDMAYMGTGAWIWERSKTATKRAEALEGYGQSLLMQGGFLFLFDGIMVLVHQSHGKQLKKAMENVELTAGPQGIGLRYNF